MTVKLLYFAWVREKTGIGEEEISVPAEVTTVAELLDWQRERGDEFASAFEQGEVIRVAIDQKHAPHDAVIKGAREIAFFPPVTGG